MPLRACSLPHYQLQIDLIEGLKDSYTQFRNENYAFDKVMALADELMNKHEIVCWEISGSCKKKLPARLDNTHVDSTLCYDWSYFLSAACLCVPCVFLPFSNFLCK